MDMHAALAQFFYSRDLTPSSREWYRKGLEAFIAWCANEGVTTPDGIDKTLVRKFLNDLAEKPGPKGRILSSHTRHGYARAVRAFTYFCAEDGITEVKPDYWRKGMPKRDAFVKQVFTPTEISSLLAACHDPVSPALAARDKAIICVLLDTGIRASELRTLTLDRVYFAPTDAHIIVNGKGRKQRQIPLGKKSRLALHRYVHQYRPYSDHTEVFLTRHGTPLHEYGLVEILFKLRDRTGLRMHMNPHKFRHTFSHMFVKNGGDVLRLSRLLGHSSVVTTEQYIKSFNSEDAKGVKSVLDDF